jgi:hypothetical protein
VAQGWSPAYYANAVKEFQNLGYRYIALGGMVPLKTNEILLRLRRVKKVLHRGTRLHRLGVTRLDRIHEFKQLGVVSFDSTSPLLQAFKDDKDNYYTVDRTYSAIRVPQVEGNAKLRNRIVAGEVTQGEARRLEMDVWSYWSALTRASARSKRWSGSFATTRKCTTAAQIALRSARRS